MVVTLLPITAKANGQTGTQLIEEENEINATSITSANLVESEFAYGNGTPENPYQIQTVEQLNSIRGKLDAHYLQTADIDLGGVEWCPIGQMGAASDSGSTEFSGSYDGNGYKISNLTISKFDADNVCIGLFAISNGIIKNVSLDNCHISIDVSAGYIGFGGRHNTCVGGIVGYCSGTVENCSVSGNIDVRNVCSANIGGIVGNGNLCKDLTNSADIFIGGVEYRNNSGVIQCGGVVGTVPVNAAIANCTNYGTIVASADNFLHCGGISGEYGAIDSCVNYGNISGKVLNYKSYTSFGGNCNVGGIVGLTSSYKNDNCKNYGDISSTKNDEGATCYSGGIIGFLGYYTSGAISNCYNYGKRITADENCAGRVVGIIWIDNVDNLYSTSETLVNGKIPIQDIGINKRNGANLEANATRLVYFLNNWDAATRTVKFGGPTLISPDTYTVADSVNVSDIDSLLNRYILVAMEQGDSPLEYTITDIQPVESKIGTVSATGEHSLTIDRTTYPVREDFVLASYDGQEILYHTYDGTIMDFTILEEDHGILGKWDEATKKITIGQTEYPTNNLTDFSFMDNIRDYFQKDVCFLVANSLNYCPMIKITGLYHPGGGSGDFNADVYHANWLSQDVSSAAMLNNRTPSDILSKELTNHRSCVDCCGLSAFE